MKRILPALFAMILAPAFGADWWAMPTICQPSTSQCYSSMLGSGFDPGEWDNDANCYGKKMICPGATISGEPAPIALSKSEISDPMIVNEDFDITAQDPNGNYCWGVRKTRNNGTHAKVGPDWFNVYCNGVFDAPDEILPTGSIMLSVTDQPDCSMLRDVGYIGTLNGSCYGAYKYPPTDFFLECVAGDLLPSRIIVLNGAPDPYISASASPSPSTYPTDEASIAAIFEQMLANAAEQRQLHSTPRDDDGG